MRIRRSINILAVATMLVTNLVGTASAAPLQYDEYVNGDLRDSIDPTNVGVLDVGVNTVNAFFYCAPLCDQDAFRFTIAENTAVTSIRYSWQVQIETDPSVGTSRLVGQDWGLARTSGDFQVVSHFTHCVDDYPGDCSLRNEHTSPIFVFGDALSFIQPGIERDIRMNGQSFRGFGPGALASVQTQFVDYEWQITVAAIPVPSAAWLFVSGLGVLGWLRRQRANQVPDFSRATAR